MEKCWYRRVHWIINFPKNLNTKSSYKSLGGVWDAVCLNTSWCGIDIGSELKCVTYCSASRNDSEYQRYAGSVGLFLCPFPAVSTQRVWIQAYCTVLHLCFNFSFILIFDQLVAVPIIINNIDLVWILVGSFRFECDRMVTTLPSFTIRD